MYAIWNGKKFKLIDNIEINKSSREISFSDLTVDFANYTIDDLPYAQQEVKIYDKNNDLVFTGFVSDYKLPSLTTHKSIKKELQLSLYSPQQMTTKRTVTVSKTDSIDNIIKEILSPLIEDGFIINEINLKSRNITVKFIAKTIEECLNLLSNKYSLWWYIDENKEITITDIEYQFNKTAKKIINIDNYKNEINGLISITPVVENVDYANIINLKNARIFYNLYTSTSDKSIEIAMKKGDTYKFENPIDVSLDTAKRMFKEKYSDDTTFTVSNIVITLSSGTQAYIICGFNTSGEILPGINYKNISTNDDDNQLFTLQIDSTFTNLATGIKYNGESNITITNLLSNTALRYSTVKLINWKEIYNYAGIISQSGQIEKIIDGNEKWFTVKEAIDYIRSAFIINNKTTNKITLNYDKENDLVIGDKITFNLIDFFTNGDFIITDIKQSKEWNNPFIYEIELRNTNLLENYIDFFRATNSEEQESQINTEYVIEYAEEEIISESHTITQDEEA